MPRGAGMGAGAKLPIPSAGADGGKTAAGAAASGAAGAIRTSVATRAGAAGQEGAGAVGALGKARTSSETRAPFLSGPVAGTARVSRAGAPLEQAAQLSLAQGGTGAWGAPEVGARGGQGWGAAGPSGEEGTWAQQRPATAEPPATRAAVGGLARGKPRPTRPVTAMAAAATLPVAPSPDAVVAAGAGGRAMSTTPVALGHAELGSRDMSLWQLVQSGSGSSRGSNSSPERVGSPLRALGPPAPRKLNPSPLRGMSGLLRTDDEVVK